MKKISILIAICMIALVQAASAQLHTESSSEDLRLGRPHPYPIGGPVGQAHTQSISFDDGVGPGNAGTYNSTDTFSFDIFLTYAGYNSAGLSLWFDTTANAAPHIVITGFTWGTTFINHGNASGFPMGFTLFESNGMYTNPNPSDFGSSTPFGTIGPGTYLVGHLSLSLSGLAPGVYVLQSDSTLPHGSEATSFDGSTFQDEPIPTATYTITIVPEPSTFALLVSMAIGAAVLIRRSGCYCAKLNSSKRPVSAD